MDEFTDHNLVLIANALKQMTPLTEAAARHIGEVQTKINNELERRYNEADSEASK